MRRDECGLKHHVPQQPPPTFTSSGIIPSSITTSFHQVAPVSQTPYFFETGGLCTA